MKRSALALLIALTLVFTVSVAAPSPVRADEPTGFEFDCLRKGGGLGGPIFTTVVSADQIGETILLCHSQDGIARFHPIFQ